MEQEELVMHVHTHIHTHRETHTHTIVGSVHSEGLLLTAHGTHLKSLIVIDFSANDLNLQVKFQK